MTDNYAIAIQNTLAAVWGQGGYKTWVEAMPTAMPPLNPKQTALLRSAIRLLNWNATRLNSFLQEKMAIATVEELEASQIDPLFDFLHSAIADWQSYRLPGKPANSLSSLSSRYWQARLALYPEAEASQRKKRSKWIIEGYIPPDRDPDPKPDPDRAPEPDRDRDPDPDPDFWDWERNQFPDRKEWYIAISA